MTDKLREAAQQALDELKHGLQFGSVTRATAILETGLVQQDAQAASQGDDFSQCKPPMRHIPGVRVDLLRKAATAAPTPPAQPTQAATDVLAERRRQIEAEGWTSSHDDEYLQSGSLAAAAACYALSAAGLKNAAPSGWPWSIAWWKPTTPRRDLVKAGALILAEIERLDRQAATQGGQT